MCRDCHGSTSIPQPGENSAKLRPADITPPPFPGKTHHSQRREEKLEAKGVSVLRRCQIDDVASEVARSIRNFESHNPYLLASKSSLTVPHHGFHFDLLRMYMSPPCSICPLGMALSRASHIGHLQALRVSYCYSIIHLTYRYRNWQQGGC